MRRLHPRNPAAFLVDGNQQAVAAVNGPQFVRQGAQLGAILHVAAEQDVTRRIGIAKEVTFAVSQGQPRKAENRGYHARKFAAWRNRGKARTGVFDTGPPPDRSDQRFT